MSEFDAGRPADALERALAAEFPDSAYLEAFSGQGYARPGDHPGFDSSVFYVLQTVVPDVVDEARERDEQGTWRTLLDAHRDEMRARVRAEIDERRRARLAELGIIS